MSYLLDTDVVIHLRDGVDWVNDRMDELDPPMFISAITRIELENGVQRDPALAISRRAALDAILTQVSTLDLGSREIGLYREIIEATGYSRRKMADRVTAATAIAAGLPLVTFNGRDFRDVPGLDLIEWMKPD